MKKISSIFPAFILLTSFISAHTGEDEFAHHMVGGFYGGGMYFFGWIFMILILVALVLFIVWLIKQIQKPKKRR